MSLFESIPIRSNANTEPVEASWWNIIRTKLIEAFGDIPETSKGSFAIANNQASYANITGLLIDKDETTSAMIAYRIKRSTDTPTIRYEVGLLDCHYVGGAWETFREINVGNALGDGTDEGPFGALRLEPTTGQAEYQSSNLSGGDYAGTIEWRIVRAWNV
jgi:hypothetical protein